MGMVINKYKLTPFKYFELGVNKKYAISGTNLDNLRKWLNEESISSTFLFNNQSEYLVSVKAYPFWMEKFFDGIGTSALIPIGPFGGNETHVTGKEITSQKAPIKIGEYTFNSHWLPNNEFTFLDYAPYTKVTAYIPYIGFRELNVNEIMGTTIEFYAQVDFDNGILTVWMEKWADGIGNVMIQSWETQIGIDIALNRTNGTDLARNMFLWGIKAVTGTFGLSLGANNDSSKANMKAISTGGDIATGFIGANQHHVYRGNVGTGVNALENPTSIYLIIEREQPEIYDIYLNDYRKLNGLPLHQTKVLSTLTGYTEIGEIHFNPMGEEITDDEISEIIDLLRSGVIL